MHAPGTVRTALRAHVTCGVCEAVRSNLYMRKCKHLVCAACFPASRTCSCGKRSVKPPVPVDMLTRDVLRYVFGKTPCDAEQLKADVLERARPLAHKLRKDYMEKLGAELKAYDDPVHLVRCGCGHVCVRRTAVKTAREFHGCPAWTPADPKAGCGFFQWLSSAQRAPQPQKDLDQP